MDHKTFESFFTKANTEEGIVESIIAVMGNADLGDDVIHPGAFAKTISERLGKIRVLDQHRTDSTLSVIGRPLEMKELTKDELPPELLEAFPGATGGLYAKTQYLMNTPEGRGVFDRIAAGAIDEYSIGYDALDVDFGTALSPDGKKRTVRNLRTLKLYEYSPVIWGMNTATQTLSSKTDDKRRRRRGGGGGYGHGYMSKPWKIFKEDGKWVVRKVDENGDPTGEPLGTHDSRGEALAQMRALYANVDKAVNYTAVSREVTEAFNEQFGTRNMMQMGPDTEMLCVTEVFDDHVIVCDMMCNEYYQVDYAIDQAEEVVFTPRDEWVEGEMVFVPEMSPTGEVSTMSVDITPLSVKVGRVLSTRNVGRITSALKSLMEALSDAGVDFSSDSEPAAAPDSTSAGPHPKENAPTVADLKSIEIEIEQLHLIQVE